MKIKNKFRPYNLDQLYLLPPDIKSWLPDDHLIYFIIDVTNELNLKPIYKKYKSENGGAPAYHPAMMTALLLYAYCCGIPSSRKIEKATYESVPFRVLSGDQHPDHDTISEFRRLHLQDLSRFFIQVLQICQKAGLVKLGHVALDGTKIQSNASKHKAMSYVRMVKKEKELSKEVKRLLDFAEETDNSEDQKFGKGKQDNDLPDELKLKKSRLQKIREAKKALEEEAASEYEDKKEQYEAKKKAHEQRGGKGRAPKPPSKKPDDKKQYNFTDPESRIMKAGGKNNFTQGYNCQAAVDEKNQIIIAADVTQDPNDKQQLENAIESIKKNMNNQKPKKLSADAGYFSEENCRKLHNEKIDGYIAVNKIKHGQISDVVKGRLADNATEKETMSKKLQTKKGKKIYAKRKHIVEPVFGQIKEARSFRRFSFRGLQKCNYEWSLVCIAHNLLKLFRSKAGVSNVAI